MFWIDGEPAAFDTRMPKRTRHCSNTLDYMRRADGERKLQPQPTHRRAMIVDLAATLIGFRSHGGGAMSQHYRRRYFISMLPAGTAPSLVTHIALGEQFVQGEARRMDKTHSREHTG